MNDTDAANHTEANIGFNTRAFLVRSGLLLFLNAPLILMWLAFPGDHGVDEKVVYAIIATVAALYLGAVVALAADKRRLSLALGLAAPIAASLYVAFFFLLGLFLST